MSNEKITGYLQMYFLNLYKVENCKYRVGTTWFWNDALILSFLPLLAN